MSKEVVIGPLSVDNPKSDYLHTRVRPVVTEERFRKAEEHTQKLFGESG